LDIFGYDESLREEGYRVIAGIDEAGRGPLAGPVVAAAVILPRSKRITGLRDSKKIPDKERRSLFWDVLCIGIDVGVGIIGNEMIDRVNILQATRLAMESAVNDLSLVPDLLLVDALKLHAVAIPQIPLIKGEIKSASIAAASIIAKVVRDRLMERYDTLYPGYGFNKHKGYATGDHIRTLALLGPCPIHRRSFAPVMSLPLPFSCPEDGWTKRE
jgi:ribonuclease HII